MSARSRERQSHDGSKPKDTVILPPHDTVILSKKEQKEHPSVRKIFDVMYDGTDEKLDTACRYILNHLDDVRAGIETQHLLDKLAEHGGDESDIVSETRNALEKQLEEIREKTGRTEIQTEIQEESLKEAFLRKLKEIKDNYPEKTKVTGIKREFDQWLSSYDKLKGKDGAELMGATLYKLLDTWDANLEGIKAEEAQELRRRIGEVRTQFMAGPEI